MAKKGALYVSIHNDKFHDNYPTDAEGKAFSMGAFAISVCGPRYFSGIHDNSPQITSKRGC